ncbi:hypothetical protein CSOJ01_05240 [Colletotrichum sojae]|uniref:Uncharacterized protein n=1 Tax=Colletotrichum sojae TaxID=2175907 RepID=A0A8H6MXV7_9PEZI|nr:hypothetical protein CSOJ01_05240 [Colletotrichum sojae]
MGLAVKRLSKDVFSANSATPELARVLCQAANLEEESIINLNQPFLRRWAPIPPCLLGTAPSSPCTSESRDPRGRDKSKSRFCQSLLHPSRWYSDFDIFKNALATVGNKPEPQDFGLGPACEGWFWLERGLRVSALASMLSNWTSTRDRINLWMLDVLHKSDHLLAMLRCSALLDPREQTGWEGPKADDEACGESQFWGRQWTADLLQVFEGDLDHPVEDPCAEQSLGALDSRENDGAFKIPVRRGGGTYPKLKKLRIT